MRTLYRILTLLALTGQVACTSQNRTSDIHDFRGSITTDCPLTDRGETAEDCPWAGLSRHLLNHPSPSLDQALQEQAPALHHAMTDDFSDRNTLAIWGQSLNFDSSAKAQIIDPFIIKGLLDMALLPAPAGPEQYVVHAGVEHTYGYLFSTLKTPYGFKRQRWVRGNLENGFALKSPLLSPLPEDGSFLRNVSYFFGRIAFRDNAMMRSTVDRIPAAAELKNYPFDSLKITTVVENFAVDASRTIRLHTDLVTMPNPAKEPGIVKLLIYSYEDSAAKTPLLISGWPIKQDAADDLLKPKNLGPNQNIKLRYNVFIPGVNEVKREWQGSRESR